ncbi:acyl-CoA dehydrogenase family protein [Bacillus pseudomycoides]|uniref:acyl-CoA dehydrogenase family protein n=1 Tax=Bacillus pseudomycoides TaxID=64104 RepID=UPI000BF522A3|nr:acyl-CoA dehydrogenase family protein [Bacillus pseudomycoides]PGD73692.1 hypothetical protein COM46_21680 [Bacillus pseudomycoides]
MNTIETFKYKIENLKQFIDSNNLNRKKEPQEYINFLIQNQYTEFFLLNNNGFEFTKYIEFLKPLSQVSASLALSFSMHLYTMWGIKYLTKFKNVNAQSLFSEIIRNNHLICSLNDPNLYFLSTKDIREKGLPIVAERKENGDYIVNGLKKYVSLEPYVKYLPVYAQIKNVETSSYGIAILLIDKFSSGVKVEQTWDSMAMKDTDSNDIYFSNVIVPQNKILISEKENINKANIFGYLFRFNISCVYYSIAENALEYIVGKCKEKKVYPKDIALSRYPGVQFSLANMLIKLETMKSQLHKLGHLMESFYEHGENSEIDTTSLITKEYITATAQEIINEGMKIEGIASLSQNSPLSQLLLDCKAGQFHPPQRDITLEILAKRKLGIISLRNRWC